MAPTVKETAAGLREGSIEPTWEAGKALKGDYLIPITKKGPDGKTESTSWRIDDASVVIEEGVKRIVLDIVQDEPINQDSNDWYLPEGFNE